MMPEHLRSLTALQLESTPVITPTVPSTVKWGGIIGIVQSCIGIAYACVLIFRELTGQHDPSIVYETDNANTWVGYGTAVFFLIVFGAVITGCITMMRGRKWGRGPVIMLNMILLLITYYIFSAGQVFWAVVVGISALACLGLLFSPRSLHWAASNY
jgi:hypothetical protein